MYRLSSDKRGFSLVELIIVIAVLAIIATIIIPSTTGVQDAAKEQAAIAAAENLNLAMSRYKINMGGDTSGWSGKTDEEKYQLLKDNKYLSFPEPDWTAYQNKAGASMGFPNDLDTKVTIVGINY